MNKRVRIIVILGVLCLLLVGYFVISNLSGNEDSDDEGIILSSMNTDEITAFSYQHHEDAEYDDDLYSFVKEDGVWYYEADKEFPVNQMVVNTKATIISEITAERLVEENAEDIAQYGLDTPYLSVSVSDAENAYMYHVGDYNESTMTYYIMQDGEDTVYLADANLFIAFDVQLWDLIDKEPFPEMDVETFKKITFEFPEEKIVIKNDKLEKDYIKSQWYLLDENSNVIEDTNIIVTAQYPKLIAALDYLREVDYKCEKSEYDTYGFNNPPLVITVDYEIDGAMDQLVLTIGSQSSENYIYEDYYIMSNKSDAVFTIDYALLESIVIMDKNSMLSN